MTLSLPNGRELGQLANSEAVTRDHVMPLDFSRRVIVVTAFVAAWTGATWSAHLGANWHLLLGIPAMIGFQLFVAQKPILDLWYVGGTRRLRVAAIVVALAAAVVPLWDLISHLGRHPLSVKLWLVSAVLGAFAMAIPLSQPLRRQFYCTLKCLGTSGVVGIALMVLSFLLRHWLKGFSVPSVGQFSRVALSQFALFLPVCFFLEEVVFRGCLGNFLNPPEEPFSWGAAVWLSCLWGWWHLPLLSPTNAIQVLGAVIILPLIHVPVGIGLSRFQWESRSVLPGAATHALIDAVRNALGLMH